MTDLLNFELGAYTDAFQTATLDLKDNEIMRRIWEHDHTVWQDDPTEITNRLGWLNIMDSMRDSLSRMQKLASAVKDEGFTNVLLLGMGGSSLAPEVFSNIFSAQTDVLSLDILDSTDPGSVLAYESVLDLDKTL
ncbi:MAG: hypothetical protein AAFR81_28215, partial [Chloroflexota bacterium]